MTEEPKYVAQDDSELNVIFIHSKLDDIGLSANQFRIFAHLSRRAHSAGKAWPGIDSMSKVCRMHKETVIEVIRQLEAFCMIYADRKPGKSTVYRLLAPSKWVVGNGERSEPGNAPVGNGERNLSEMGNVRESIEETPKKDAAGAAAGSEPSMQSKIPLPPELDNDDFLEAINLWISERRKRRIKPYTDTGFRKLLADLARLGSARAIAAINHSIAQGYQGIFESHEAKKAGTQTRQADRNSGTFNAGTASKFAGREKLA